MTPVTLMYSFPCCIYRLRPTSPANSPSAAEEVNVLCWSSQHPAGVRCQKSIPWPCLTAVQALTQALRWQDTSPACHHPCAGQPVGCGILRSLPFAHHPQGSAELGSLRALKMEPGHPQV